jgi:hypothetical protein
MKQFVNILTKLSGLSVILLYWFDWNQCERFEPNFDWTAFNNYSVFISYTLFLIVFIKNIKPNSMYTVYAVASSITYGIFIAAYKTAEAECGTLGEGMDKMIYFNTETYPVFLANNICLILYGVLSFVEPSKNVKTSNDTDLRTSEEVKSRPENLAAHKNSSLISKYGLSSNDIFTLKKIELEISQLGVFSLKREKLRKERNKILKPYNIKFIDYVGLLDEVKAAE